ncbi:MULTISPECIES: CAP domain-containing protein [unclassified Streptomyces]|uniref:CAP domain-containing protein n=1 Tax=unclassified Streptomyces TaxID=2593676 RepID=UPI001370B560|nr:MULTISPECIES: CAP domain-containing protein [unclassified Streptomyces]MYY82278.1 CAP domain-containing protein [Streptomyces sp. SID335]MYZ18696.1 CAP domain-containing protein [Streptomyces sp. SID337]NDZ83970.1 CAP domain-containing protein [Streptomyces sp. SID10115]NEB49127.1 CAP domain-containing protein [Streptomyces sp. SID339]
MGRHRRSGAGRAAATPENHPGTVSHRRRGRAVAPVRTGLLGVSAAVAMGAVAVAAGVLPGSDGYRLGGGDDSGEVRSAAVPTEVDAQGGRSADAGRGEPSPSRGTGRSEAPKPTPSKAERKPSRTPSEKPSSQAPRRDADKDGKARTTPSHKPEKKPGTPPPGRSESSSDESTAEAAVLALVNQERAKAGCRPVRADDRLAALAGDFSADMAERDFFDHTDPDGATPWDRAEKAGIDDLGGENIARGQANAQSVMDAWMNSAGHRANILNCDYKTLGVGAHFAPGGPWWTQDFGF